MTSNFINIDDVDELSKLTVFGYIRTCQQIVNMNIPPIVSYICIAYYNNNCEYFISIGPHMDYGNKQKNIIEYYGWSNDGYNTGYGNININTVRHKNMIYKWSFKILYNNKNDICIGIDSSKRSWTHSSFALQRFVDFGEYTFYGYKINNYFLGNADAVTFGTDYYGKLPSVDIDHDDIIVMELNCKQKELNYYIKNNSFGFQNILFDNDVTYNLAVSLGGKNDSIQLIKFAAMQQDVNSSTVDEGGYNPPQQQQQTDNKPLNKSQSFENNKVEERSFEVMKYTDKQSEYIVFGFIHEIQKILYDTDTIIPSLIYHICLAFYFIDYRWDPNIKSPHLEISGDGHIVTKKCRNDITDKWQGIVSQITFSSGRHGFEIDIIKDGKTSNSWRCIIGVVPVTFDPNHTAWLGSQDSWGYIAGTGGKCHIDGKSISYGDKYGGNDKIKCVIDFDKHTIEFFKNGKYQGIAFNNLTDTVRPAVSITGNGTSIKISNVNYEKTVIHSQQIQSWLSSTVCLPQYYQVFIMNGYESLEQIFNIKNKAELKRIGITLKGHQVKLMADIYYNRRRNVSK